MIFKIIVCIFLFLEFLHNWWLEDQIKKVTLITVMKDTYYRGQYDYIEYYKVIFEEKCNETVELLYDLIKADLVVKE